MVDCSTGLPLPDYWLALLWVRTMGPKVLAIEAVDKLKGKGLPAETSSIRVYAHCTTTAGHSDNDGNGATETSTNATAHRRQVWAAGSVTVLAINLGNRSTTLHVPSKLGAIEAYVMSPSHGELLTPLERRSNKRDDNSWSLPMQMILAP